jgi:TonB family protein
MNAAFDDIEGYFDTPPRLIFGKMPVYPIRAAISGVPATVTVRYTIGADGSTRDIEVIGGSGKPFSTHAVIAVREWRFEPATLGGDPIPFTVEQTISFGDGARDLRSSDKTDNAD